MRTAGGARCAWGDWLRLRELLFEESAQIFRQGLNSKVTLLPGDIRRLQGCIVGAPIIPDPLRRDFAPRKQFGRA